GNDALCAHDDVQVVRVKRVLAIGHVEFGARRRGRVVVAHRCGCHPHARSMISRIDEISPFLKPDIISRAASTHAALPEKLHAHLSDSRVARAGHITKLAAAEVSRRVIELGVVKEVEELDAELERHALPYPSVLMDGKIKVVETRPMKERPVGISKS